MDAGPASVGESLRVVRLSSETPSRPSSAAMARDTDGWVMPNSRAAREKLPVSAVRTNIANWLKRSFMLLVYISYANSANSSRLLHELSVLATPRHSALVDRGKGETHARDQKPG